MKKRLRECWRGRAGVEQRGPAKRIHSSGLITLTLPFSHYTLFNNYCCWFVRLFVSRYHKLLLPLLCHHYLSLCVCARRHYLPVFRRSARVRWFRLTCNLVITVVNVSFGNDRNEKLSLVVLLC